MWNQLSPSPTRINLLSNKKKMNPIHIKKIIKHDVLKRKNMSFDGKKKNWKWDTVSSFSLWMSEIRNKLVQHEAWLFRLKSGHPNCYIEPYNIQIIALIYFLKHLFVGLLWLTNILVSTLREFRLQPLLCTLLPIFANVYIFFL